MKGYTLFHVYTLNKINFILEKDSKESKSIECYWNKLQNKNVDNCIYARIQLSGTLPKLYVYTPL